MAVLAKPDGVTLTRHTVTKGDVDTQFTHQLEYDFDNAGVLERRVTSDIHDLTDDGTQEDFVNALLENIYTDNDIDLPE